MKKRSNQTKPPSLLSEPSEKLAARMFERIVKKAPFGVWTPADFLDLGSRDAVDKTLQRLAVNGKIRRVERGLYDRPNRNRLSGQKTAPDYKSVIDAVARRDQIRVLVDGITAANQLGLTTAVPAHVIVHTDARLRPIKIGNLTIRFRLTAPSKLYWAGRPGMRVVQALHWLHDTDRDPDRQLRKRLAQILRDPGHGSAVRRDLREGLQTLPAWMQKFLGEVLEETEPK